MSSARKNRENLGFLFLTNVRFLAKFLVSARVSSCSISWLPTDIAPRPAARASSNVDFPDPFSPTKKVTGALNSSRLRSVKQGRLKGNRPDSTLSLTSMYLKKITFFARLVVTLTSIKTSCSVSSVLTFLTSLSRVIRMKALVSENHLHHHSCEKSLKV